MLSSGLIFILYPLLQDKLTQIDSHPLPVDPTGKVACSGYYYYRYPAGQMSCPANKGAFYVLGIKDMESSGNPHPSNPGFKCGIRNWQNEMEYFEWVTGKFSADH